VYSQEEITSDLIRESKPAMVALVAMAAACSGQEPKAGPAHEAKAVSKAKGTSASGNTDLSQERARTFRWFSSLGYVDVKDRPLVHVAEGNWDQWGDDPPVNFYFFGFLLKGGQTFTGLTLGLEVRTFHKSPAGTAPHKRIGYEEVDLARCVSAYLEKPCHSGEETGADGFSSKLWNGYVQTLGKENSSLDKGMFHVRARFLSERTQVFVLALACNRHGKADLAARLYELARAMAGEANNPRENSEESLRGEVAGNLVYAEMWRAITAFQDSSVSRAQLLDRFEGIVKNFPDSQYAPRAREIAALLKQMLCEDREHARLRQEGKPFEQLSPKEQIADSIFQLRDQNGGFNIFRSPGGEEMKDSPAHRLVNMGYQAIPQLIAALGDRHFTRSVCCPDGVAWKHQLSLADYASRGVIRVGECADSIIGRIARRSFNTPDNANGDANEDDIGRRRKAAIQGWYADLQSKGEKRLLIEAAGRGDDNSPSQGELLLQKYPQEALPALIRGARQARGYPPTRADLVGLVGRVRTDKALAFLLEEVKKGPFVVSRLAAPRALHAQDRPEGLTAMMAEWAGGLPVDESDNHWADKGYYSLAEIARFLAGSGKVEAIELLARDLRQRPVGLRVAVVEAFLDREDRSLVNARTKKRPARPHTAPRNAAEARAAVEKLLVAALDDEDEQNSAGIWMGKEINCPRVCDFAGHVLWEIDPARNAFDLAAPLALRDRSRVDMINAWRKARHLPLQPAGRIIAPVPEKALEPLLDRFLRGSGSERQKARQAIEQMGLGAIPGVLGRLDRAQKKDRDALEKLSRRLACIVVHFEFAADSLMPDAALLARLDALTGKPLDPDRFPQALALMVDRLPGGVHGIRFAACRADDGTGITLRVDLLSPSRAALIPPTGRTRPADPMQRPSSWESNEGVRVGRKAIYRDTLQQALKEACAAPPLVPIEVRVQRLPVWAD
jgi:hypothetical protein